jgi:hypothetical protein
VAVAHCLEDNRWLLMMNGRSFWVLCIHNSLYCCLSEAGAYIFCCLGSFQFEQLVRQNEAGTNEDRATTASSMRHGQGQGTEQDEAGIDEDWATTAPVKVDFSSTSVISAVQRGQGSTHLQCYEYRIIGFTTAVSYSCHFSVVIIQ